MASLDKGLLKIAGRFAVVFNNENLHGATLKHVGEKLERVSSFDDTRKNKVRCGKWSNARRTDRLASEFQTLIVQTIIIILDR